MSGPGVARAGKPKLTLGCLINGFLFGLGFGFVVFYFTVGAPSYDGPWELVQEAQRISFGGQVPEIYKATIDGRECFVLVGLLSDDLECE